LDKILPVACELILIVVVYGWLRDTPVLRWLIPGLIAIYPGLIATSAWWGQYESTFTLFLVLALLALNRDRPVWAWVCFAIAILFKQPAAVLAPLLIVLNYRRYGLRSTLTGMGVCAAICGVILLPFIGIPGLIPGSGFVGALSPYLKAADIFPFMMNNAFNTWYVLAFLNNGGQPTVFDTRYADAQSIMGGFTYKDAGIIMFVAYILLLSVIMWRYADRRYEFVWATALFLGFFMLPTQVHERYIYPAAVLALLAVVQERRIWWIAIVMMWTFSYNVLGIAVPYKWPTLSLGSEVLSLPTALLNVAMFIWLTYFLLKHKTVEDEHDRELSASAA
jgi:Gpi18-like mannosyltransferase